MSRWDRYVLRPRVWAETSRSEIVPHIGPYSRGGRGRGHGAKDQPPPPDYMATMMQQFQLNQVFMQGFIDQLQNENQHGHHHQHAVVNLHDFTRLNPTVFR